MGKCSYEGFVLKKNVPKAIELFKLLVKDERSNQNYRIQALQKLGSHYLECDYTQGLECFKKAANLGDLSSQEVLAWEFRNGTAKDSEKAIYWYKLIAQRYRLGDGVEKNLDACREYLQLCSDLGDRTSKTELDNLD